MYLYNMAMYCSPRSEQIIDLVTYSGAYCVATRRALVQFSAAINISIHCLNSSTLKYCSAAYTTIIKQTTTEYTKHAHASTGKHVQCKTQICIQNTQPMW